MSAARAESLVFDLHGTLLRLASSRTGCHYQGLSAASRHLRALGRIDSRTSKKLVRLDDCFNVMRHITCASVDMFTAELTKMLDSCGTHGHGNSDECSSDVEQEAMKMVDTNAGSDQIAEVPSTQTVKLHECWVDNCDAKRDVQQPDCNTAERPSICECTRRTGRKVADPIVQPNAFAALDRTTASGTVEGPGPVLKLPPGWIATSRGVSRATRPRSSRLNNKSLKLIRIRIRITLKNRSSSCRPVSNCSIGC